MSQRRKLFLLKQHEYAGYAKSARTVSLTGKKFPLMGNTDSSKKISIFFVSLQSFSNETTIVIDTLMKILTQHISNLTKAPSCSRNNDKFKNLDFGVQM